MESIHSSVSLALMIPTFRRSGQLVELLDSLLREFGSNALPPIYVADNDQPSAAGATAAKDWACKNRLEGIVHLISVHDRGLCHCRNTGLSAAFSNPSITAVAMIDDDTVVATGWARALSSALAVHGNGVLGGPTCYVIPEGASSIVRNAPLFGIPYSRTGLVPILRSTNNCVIGRFVYEMFGGELFDLRFNTTGGEDSHFFSVCRRKNVSFFWVNEARVIEQVPSIRATDEWVLERHVLSAMNAARVSVAANGVIVGAAMQMTLALKEIFSGLFWLINPFSRDLVKARYRLRGSLGRLQGLLGLRPKHH